MTCIYTASPKKKLKTIKIPLSDSETSEDESITTFKPPNSEFIEIPRENRLPIDEIYDSLSTTRHPTSYSDSKFNVLNNQTPDESNQRSETFKLPQTFYETPPASFSDANILFGESTLTDENKSYQGSPKREFKSYFGLDSGDDLLTVPQPSPSSFDRYCVDQVFKEQSLSPTSFFARCPMCNEPVCSDDLRNHGSMNMRQQERFCLAHRRKSANKQWETKRYPKIDWDKLDSRISKHHTYLENLINGANSHYRSILKAKIDQGLDRNQRTMTSNLMPGYYGPRGLRIILENVFRTFTPLLKKRIVQDRLIAARGYTPYVQSVLVPEVASLLIQEDLLISLPEARDVMVESATIGELLQEEVRDLELPVVILEDRFDSQCSK